MSIKHRQALTPTISKLLGMDHWLCQRKQGQLQAHPKQPYVKNYSYEQFEHAYRTGYNSSLKYPGKRFDEVEDGVALDYERAKPGSALPWDTVRPAVKCGLGKNDRDHQSARSRPRCARMGFEAGAG
jgi:hypothetical protein